VPEVVSFFDNASHRTKLIALLGKPIAQHTAPVAVERRWRQQPDSTVR
jgi:hypothetical protein